MEGIKKAMRSRSVLFSFVLAAIGAALFGGVHMASAQQLALNTPVSSHQATIDKESLQDSQLQAGMIDKDAIQPSSVESLSTQIPSLSDEDGNGIIPKETVFLAPPLLLTSPVSEFTYEDIVTAVRRRFSDTKLMTDQEVMDFFIREVAVKDGNFKQIYGEIFESLTSKQLSDSLGTTVELFENAREGGLDALIVKGPQDKIYVQIKGWKPESVYPSDVKKWMKSAKKAMPKWLDTGEIADSKNIQFVLSDELIPRIQSIASSDPEIKELYDNQQFVFSTVSESSLKSSVQAVFDGVQAGNWDPSTLPKAKSAGIITRISDSSKQFLSTIADFLKKHIPAVKTKAASYADSILDGIKVWGTKVGKVARYLEPLALIFGPIIAAGGITKVVKVIKEKGVGGLFTSRDGWVGVLQSLAGILTTLGGAAGAAAIATSWTGVGGIGFGTIAAVLLAAGAALEVAAWTVENWGNIGDIIKEKYDKTVAFAKKMGTGIAATYTEFHNLVGSTLVATGAFIKKVIVEPKVVYETIKKKVQKRFPVIKERVKEIWETISVTVSKRIEKIKQVPYVIKEWKTRWVTKSKTFYKQVAYEVKKKMSKWVTKYKTMIKKIGYTVTERASRWVTKYKTKKRQQAYTAHRTEFRYFNEPRRVVRTVYSNVKKRVTSWVKGVFSWFKRTISKWVRVAKQVVSYVTERVGRAVRVAYTAYRTVKERVAYQAKEYYNIVKTKYKKIKKKIAYKVKKTYTKTITKYKEIKETVTEKVKEKYLSVKEGVKDVVYYVTKKVPGTEKVLSKVKEKYTAYETREVEEEVEVKKTINTERIEYVRADS